VPWPLSVEKIIAARLDGPRDGAPSPPRPSPVIPITTDEPIPFFFFLSRTPAAGPFREQYHERERSSPSSRDTTRFTSHFAARDTEQPRIISIPNLSDAQETRSSAREPRRALCDLFLRGAAENAPEE